MQWLIEPAATGAFGSQPSVSMLGSRSEQRRRAGKMGSKDPNKTSQAARRHGLVRACLIAITIVFGLVFSGAVVLALFGSHASSPIGTHPSERPDPFRQFDQDVAGLVERQAIWQVPKRLEVDRTARLGLVIGDASALRTQIRELVPESYPKAAGQVKVGSKIAVQLEADPSDASVTPKDAIDQSTGKHTALLWTWFVRAMHPSPELFLTAHIVVKMSDGHVLSTELPLTIPVRRTWQYTLGQVFTNWATWLSIAGVLSGAVAWIWRKRKRQSHASSYQHKPPPRSRVHASKSPRRR
jgi:hypothetical protein